MRSYPAIYFDGLTSTLHEVTIRLLPGRIVISNAGGNSLDEWHYSRLRRFNAPARLLRLGLRKNDRLSRLDIADQDAAREIGHACPEIDRSGAGARAERKRTIAWTFAATFSLVLSVMDGIPAIADRLVPAVPPVMEQRLSNAADGRIRSMFAGRNDDRPFECGIGTAEAPGQAAFEKLIEKLKAGADFKLPLKVVVIRRHVTNAVTLPGHIYVFQGLIDEARNPDELAGVITHELGHLANRDAIRSLLQATGLSFVFGSLLGDFVGGGATVFAAKIVSKLAFSRRREAEADDYAVRAMVALKANPRAFANFMERVAGARNRGSIFIAHPATPDRVAHINAITRSYHSGVISLLEDSEWAALKEVCSGYR
jgi:Zn-dependent protease with chaperone function